MNKNEINNTLVVCNRYPTQNESVALGQKCTAELQLNCNDSRVALALLRCGVAQTAALTTSTHTHVR